MVRRQRRTRGGHAPDVFERQLCLELGGQDLDDEFGDVAAHALAYFQKLTPASNGEYQATDAVIAFARDHDVLIHPVTGEYHDCGNPAGWLAANNAAAQSSALAG
ncbi:hypothetical protein [Micromonospora haikouensis]|uniref:hypothetical protein n=1 Tax=Micromonospora haikouensis TaxID=686309 RepID=UPI003D759F93